MFAGFFLVGAKLFQLAKWKAGVGKAVAVFDDFGLHQTDEITDLVTSEKVYGVAVIQQVEMPIIVPIEFNKNTITELNTNRLDHSRIIVVQDGTVAVFRKPELISPVFLDKNAIKPNDSYMYIYAAAVFGQEYNGWVRKQGVEGETFAPSSHSLVHENKEYMGGLWYVLMSPDFYHQGDGVDDIGYKYCNPKGELLDENEAPYYIPSAFLRPVLIEGINPAVV